MLASLFPSLRQVRTPLIVGALWLTFLWVLFAPALRRIDTGSGQSDIADLAQWLGKTVLLAGLALVAVFIGSFTTIREWPGGLPVIQAHDGELFVHSSLIEAVDWSGPEVLERAREVSWEQLERFDWIGRTLSTLIGAFAYQHAVLRNIDGQRHRTWKDPDDPDHWRWECMSYALALHAMTTERRLLADRLQEAHDGLFQEYDRLRSEAALRYSLILPIGALILVCSVRLTPWLLVTLAFLMLLALTGRAAEFDARRLLGRALRLRLITSPAAEALRGPAPDVPATDRSLDELMVDRVKEWMQDAQPQIVVGADDGKTPTVTFVTAKAATPEQIVQSTLKWTKNSLKSTINSYRRHV